MRKRVIAGIAVAATLSLVAAACGDKAETAKRTTPRSASDAASTLLVTLDAGLREHVYLAALATENALGGRTAGFEAAAAALDENSVALSKAIGSVFGADAETAFLPLWRSHIGFVVDYTSNFGNKAKQDKAVADLLGYTETFGAFLNGAMPAIPKAAAADLVKTHILTLKDVIDAQQAKDYTKADAMLRQAAH
ncbi:MAG: copper amine oxidase N-terminal domain-containing protein, partial [Actinomycetota bacterium]